MKILLFRKNSRFSCFFVHLIYAARKAVSFGYRVFILPNPKGIRNITDEIRRHFEISPYAVEVLIFSGNKEISVKRNIATSKGFLKMMMNRFRK